MVILRLTHLRFAFVEILSSVDLGCPVWGFVNALVSVCSNFGITCPPSSGQKFVPSLNDFPHLTQIDNRFLADTK